MLEPVVDVVFVVELVLGPVVADVLEELLVVPVLLFELPAPPSGPSGVVLIAPPQASSASSGGADIMRTL